ncbi:DUF4287 domain-containing protein [Streptomyces sp. NBC_01808]|uniref:hypothetical protein n=1 Tax=Streptomyces sp. NBC_01808 TaxID=2975947 RepID=UPI002DDB19F6|nr:hypothetical protein [Streptomyces sp. NBC_01808]WSA42424.1 DUF4287 domain-containing protein [Streptomyces sp. NBC_01808]
MKEDHDLGRGHGMALVHVINRPRGARPSERPGRPGRATSYYRPSPCVQVIKLRREQW